MELKKLVTLTFKRNVGAGDRAQRVVTGAALVGFGWYSGLPFWASLALSTFGVMWTATGVLSRCSIYYLLGHTTCPARADAQP